MTFAKCISSYSGHIELNMQFAEVMHLMLQIHLQWTLVNPVTYVPLLLDRINQRTGLSNSV
jgi:hypothetical protein